MSAPSEPSVSLRPSRRGSFQSNEERQSEQAGRSATNLHAQLSAASFRSQRPQSPPGEPERASNEDHTLKISSAASNDLHTTHSNVSKGSSRGGSSGSSQDVNAVGTALIQGLHPPPPIPASRPYSLRQISSSTSLARIASPRSVRDLGRDFDRYYNPFATPSQSTTDLTSLLPRQNSIDADRSGATLNPFNDETRSANSPEVKTAASATVPATAITASTDRPIDNNDADQSYFAYLDDRLGAPDTQDQGYTFPLYWHEKEWDDDMHLPSVDDDVKLKPKLRDFFTRETIVSTIGLAFMIIGLLCVFVMLPVLSWSGISIIDYNDDDMGTGTPITWATINATRKWPLLKNMRVGLIDPETPKTEMTRTGVDGEEYHLVFSDEFNDINRTFYPGDDPYWFAPDFWYGATRDLEWYDPDAVTTWDGALRLQLDAFGNHGLQFRSGMLNSWNQLCFKGGIFEVSVSLPYADVTPSIFFSHADNLQRPSRDTCAMAWSVVAG